MPSITDIYLRVFDAIKNAFKVKIVESNVPIGGADPVGLKNIAEEKINPAREDGNLANIKTLAEVIEENTRLLKQIGLMYYDPEIQSFFIKMSGSEYYNFIKKLATVKGIDFKVLGKTDIYTVPTGCKAVIWGVVIRVVTLIDPECDGIAVLIRASDEYELTRTFSPEDFQDAETVIAISKFFDIDPFRIVESGDKVQINVTTAETGTALTFDVDLIGYLIKE